MDQPWNMPSSSNMSTAWFGPSYRPRPFEEMSSYEEFVAGTGSEEESTDLPAGLKQVFDKDDDDNDKETPGTAMAFKKAGKTQE